MEEWTARWSSLHIGSRTGSAGADRQNSSLDEKGTTMGRTGYLAAAAAGMIAPVAIALPAFASPQSPLLAAGASSILQNNWDDGGDDGGGDGGGNGGGVNTDPNLGGDGDGDGDGGDGDGDQGNGDQGNGDQGNGDQGSVGRGDGGQGPILRGNPNIWAAAATAPAAGNASFLIQGNNLASFVPVTISSPGLEAACLGGTTFDEGAQSADRYGYFAQATEGLNCAPGKYTITVAEQSSPFNTYTAQVTVR
jgi:hypothetical protein